MGDKKTIKNKENYQPMKKTIIQHIDYSQQVHIPTLNTIDFKNLTKSIDLKKQISIKKPVSRKSRCVSVKQTCTSIKKTMTQPIKYQNILRKFQELKALQERGQRSKSKSAKSIRESNKTRSPLSKVKNKVSNKKLNLTALMNKTLKKTDHYRTQLNSRMSLTNKLDKTLKKINQDQYFNKDQEDSLIPFISTSQVCNQEEYHNSRRYQFSRQQFVNEDDINIFQMRKFCKTMQNQDCFENAFKKNINYFRGDQYEMMATRIQRAWRRYRTKKLVDRYADIFFNLQVHQHQSQSELQESSEFKESSQSQTKNFNRQKFQLEEIIQNQKYIKNIKCNEFFQQAEEIKSIQTDNEKYRQKSGYLFFDDNHSESFIQQIQDQRLLQIERLYAQKTVEQERMITYISNLDEQFGNDKLQLINAGKVLNAQKVDIQGKNKYQLKKQKIKNQQYQTIISQMKKIQLQKWNEVIQLLEESKQKKNPAQLKFLLNKLQEKSQMNKKQLQQIQKQEHIFSSDKYLQKKLSFRDGNKEFKILNKRQRSGLSETSDFKKQEQFDSRKYIQYLDGDMFLLDKDKSSENSQLIIDQRLGKTISKFKQKQLLAVLNTDDYPSTRLRSHCASKSQNLSYLIKSQNLSYLINDSEKIVLATNARLSKSISQKNIKKVIRQISPRLQFYNEQSGEDQLNLDLIRQQFLQNFDQIQEMQKLFTDEQLKVKIKQSLQLEDDRNQQFSEDELTPPARISLDLGKTFNLVTRQQQQQIKNPKDKSFYRHQNKTQIVIQNIHNNIDQVFQNENQQNEKVQNICFMVFNVLILEVLKQIPAYDLILQKFKKYSQAVKAQPKESKKGFHTNHTEVKSYVQGLIAFLLKQEPQVFKNLQIPAGPSALQMLHYMHPNEGDDDMDEDSNVSQDQTSVMVIPNRMFDRYWVIREKSLKFDIQITLNLNQQRKNKYHEDLKNLTKVFYRSIFDTFNECLDLQRNFGQAGRPYPWKKTSSFHHTKKLGQIQNNISNSQKRMTQIATSYCGLIIQKNQMARISMQGSDDYIQHVQQDRMSRMLAQDLIQGQQRWTFYDDQQLELLVQIGNFITIGLILQVADQLASIARH